jgi:hypothetical protein
MTAATGRSRGRLLSSWPADLPSAASGPLVSRKVTPELPAGPHPRIDQQRRLDTRSILTTAMVSPAASRSTAACCQEVGALPSERRRHPRARNCAALGTYRPHEQPRGGGHAARPVHRGEKLSVCATDVDKILVEGAKAFRANAGPNEHAFVNASMRKWPRVLQLVEAVRTQPPRGGIAVDGLATGAPGRCRVFHPAVPRTCLRRFDLYQQPGPAMESWRPAQPPILLWFGQRRHASTSQVVGAVIA